MADESFDVIDSDGEDQPELIRRPSTSSDGDTVSSASTADLGHHSSGSTIDLGDELYGESDLEASLRLPLIASDGNCVDDGHHLTDDAVVPLNDEEDQTVRSGIIPPAQPAFTPASHTPIPWADTRVERDMAFSEETVRSPLVDSVSSDGPGLHNDSRAPFQLLQPKPVILPQGISKSASSKQSSRSTSPVTLIRLVGAMAMVSCLVGIHYMSNEPTLGLRGFSSAARRQTALTPKDHREFRVNGTLKQLQLQPDGSVGLVLKDQIIAAIDRTYNSNGAVATPTNSSIRVLKRGQPAAERLALFLPPIDSLHPNRYPAKVGVRLSQGEDLLLRTECTHKTGPSDGRCNFVGPGVVLVPLPARTAHGFVNVWVDYPGSPPETLVVDLGSKLLKAETYHLLANQFFNHTQQTFSHHFSLLSLHQQRIQSLYRSRWAAKATAGLVQRARLSGEKLMALPWEASLKQAKQDVVSFVSPRLADLGQATKRTSRSLADTVDVVCRQSRSVVGQLVRVKQDTLSALSPRLAGFAQATKQTRRDFADKVDEACRQGRPVIARGIRNAKRLQAMVQDMVTARNADTRGQRGT